MFSIVKKICRHFMAFPQCERIVLKNWRILWWAIAIWILWGFLWSCSTASGDGECEDIPAALIWWETLPKQEEYYYNATYGYSVMIPAGLVGRSEPPSNPQHGFGILLSQQPNAYIWVEGQANSLEFESLDQLADHYLEIINEDALKIVAVQKRATTLDGIPALRVTVRHECPTTQIVRDYFLLIDSRQIVYTLALFADATVYEDTRRILEEIASSWQRRVRCSGLNYMTAHCLAARILGQLPAYQDVIKIPVTIPKELQHLVLEPEEAFLGVYTPFSGRQDKYIVVTSHQLYLPKQNRWRSIYFDQVTQISSRTSPLPKLFITTEYGETVEMPCRDEDDRNAFLQFLKQVVNKDISINE